MMMPMARDLAKYGIRCAAIAPGIFETPMGAGIPKKLIMGLQNDTPYKRFGKPFEFAHFIGAMIENAYISGVHMRVDGATKLSHL